MAPRPAPLMRGGIRATNRTAAIATTGGRRGNTWVNSRPCRRMYPRAMPAVGNRTMPLATIARVPALRETRLIGHQCALQVASLRLRTRPCLLHSSLLHDPFSNSNLAVCAKLFRPLASHGTPWRHSKILHRCDTQRHCRSGDHKRGRRRGF
jgi:hypothetical protein